MRRWTVLIVSMLVLAACEPVPPTTPPIVTPTRGIITPVSTPEDEALPPPEWTRCDSLGDTAAPGYVNQATEITVLDPGAGADSAQGPSAPVYFVDGQLIVTGRAAEIEEVIELANKNLGNQRLQPGRQTGGKTDGVIGRLVTIQGMETRLYEFQPGAMDALAVMDEVRQASLDLKRPVFADLNYVLTATPPRTCRAGSSPSSGGANPLSGEDSPLSGEDSPLSGEDSPFRIAGGTAPADLFWRQWALNDAGAGGIQVAAAGQRRPDRDTGKGTRLVILDTSPFARTGLAVFSGRGWMTPTLEICVEHPTQVNLTMSADCDNLPDQSDHGVFVASLAHAVAPNSEVHLLRVLNDHGRGDLGATLYALSGLDRNRLNRTRTVINMSLGFVPVRATDAKATWKTVCENLGLVECGSPDAVFALVDRYPTLDPDQRRQLEDVLDGLTLRLYIADLLASGVVIVAAAGNESDAGNILAPQLPASFEDSFDAVLAVAGSTYKRERAFYANRGTLAAPGGGDNTPGCEAEPPCDPGAATPCWCSPDHWLIGVGTQRNAGAGPPVTWRYSAWVGTSFAAPLVSGLAADAFPASGNASQLAQQMRQPQTCSVAADPDPPDAALGRGIASFCP